MADPLSIASSVAGLVSLGLTLCGGLHNYFSSVKGRHQDIETASRSLTLLQSNIFIIQSSTLKLGHRHALSANGVNQGLANCEFELVALQHLMLNLTRDEGLSDMTGKLRKQIMLARYPFDQKKLIQLQDQLSKANATLSTFVQNFNLDINIGISEDLQILKNYTNANDSITHNMLGTIARRLDAISPAVQRIEIEMATLSQHVQDNCLDTSSHVSDVVVQPRYLQNSHKEESTTKRLNHLEYDNGNNIAHLCMDVTRTILRYLWIPYSLATLPPLYNFIAAFDTFFCVEDIAHSEVMSLNVRSISETDSLRVWGQYPEIAEAFGFNDIFRAVMQQDRKSLEAITIGDQLPPGILETDMYGRNILHASITWSEGLGLLLQRSEALPLLCDNEPTSISPLELAVKLSWRVCTQPDKWVLCQNCCCADSVQVLLEADCCLPVNLLSLECLEQCSLRCRKLLFKHLEDRRRRLRDLSLALLPSEVIERHGVALRSSELRDGGLEISHGLKPFSSDHYYGGLFEKPLSPQICSLANEFGIKPSNEGGLGPLLGRVEVLYQNSRSEEMFGIETTYLDWLLKHDLKLEYVIGGFQTSALHDFGGKIGSILVPFLRYPIGNPFYFRCREGISLITKICNSEMQSDLPCPCISRAFNRPLASLFSGYTTSALSSSSEKLHVIFDIWFLVELIERKITEIDTPHLARCAIHTMTMELLGIRHVGPCARNHFDRQMKESGEDEWAEVLDEDRLLLERLDDLDEEFEREFQSRNESVRDFIRGYYSERMREVVKEMNASPTDDYRRGLLAAGVVLADPGE
ncbi:hypothetical protein NOF04DRAFT_1417766 [Fusarium oxysporum II5]|nr:hypothetical protein NOF04DRAFT_1417766 [Fusarium oxysporum II5]